MENEQEQQSTRKNASSKKTLLIIIIIIIVLLILIVNKKSGSHNGGIGPNGNDQVEVMDPATTVVVSEKIPIGDDGIYTHPIYGYSFTVPAGIEVIRGFKGDDKKQKDELIVLLASNTKDQQFPLRESIVIQPVGTSDLVDLLEDQSKINVSTSVREDQGVIQMVHTASTNPEKEEPGAEVGFVVKKEGKKDIIVEAYFESAEPEGDILQMATDIVATMELN